MSIGFCVPALFEMDYAEALVHLNQKAPGPGRIIEAYGALPGQVLGSLRTKIIGTSLEQLSTLVEVLRSGGIEFNYLFNTSLLGGNEHTHEGRRRIHEHINSLLDCGIRRFTVAVPFLAQFLRRHYPEIEIVASIVAGIQSASMAQRFLDLGAIRMVVVQDVNRRLDILESLISMNASVELLVNSPCLHACPDRAYHANLTSLEAMDSVAMGYQKPHGEVATCLLQCRLDRFSDPAEILRIPWIRPEDVPDYNAMGVTHFKLDGRIASASYNLERISAYLRGRHDGNLLYLLMQNVPQHPQDLNETLNDFYRMYVDNARLDGLVARMPCLRREMSCRTCGFCNESAASHVMIDPDWARRRKRELEVEIAGRYAFHSLDGKS